MEPSAVLVDALCACGCRFRHVEQLCAFMCASSRSATEFGDWLAAQKQTRAHARPAAHARVCTNISIE